VAEPEVKRDNYSVKISSAAHRDLRKLVKKISEVQRRRIGQKIKDLSQQPRPLSAEKLTNKEEYRLRDGDYRILYEVSDVSRTVRIGRIQDRRDVYRKR
jgi:mRNA interferase RelE/StbE